jgi:hypothetical protein
MIAALLDTIGALCILASVAAKFVWLNQADTAHLRQRASAGKLKGRRADS